MRNAVGMDFYLLDVAMKNMVVHLFFNLSNDELRLFKRIRSFSPDVLLHADDRSDLLLILVSDGDVDVVSDL